MKTSYSEYEIKLNLMPMYFHLYKDRTTEYTTVHVCAISYKYILVRYSMTYCSKHSVKNGKILYVKVTWLYENFNVPFDALTYNCTKNTWDLGKNLTAVVKNINIHVKTAGPFYKFAFSTHNNNSWLHVTYMHMTYVRI